VVRASIRNRGRESGVMVEPVVAIHAGAAGLSEDLRKHEPDCRSALEAALQSARAALESGGDAVTAVQSAVRVMETFALFNAGYGSALCADGSVEMSAALMRGSDRAAGAVAAITRTLHPIVAARALLDAGEVMMIGDHADAYAAARGAEQREPAYFVTDRQLKRLERRTAERAWPDHGTVGAVCRDADGMLAAATSTGGRVGQLPGRVGDSPVIGAGTWADRHVAVSCTGAGETFIRAGAARLLAALVEQGTPLNAAAQAVMDEVRDSSGSGGLIAVDARGNVAMPFSTGAMPRGTWRASTGSAVEIS
jgi:beta-aspartyl-peptidase (threonine type)